jgi:FkbM family methyltransferase
VIVEGLLAARLGMAGRGLDSLFYIEIGANHPVQTSNTYLFYRKHQAAGVLVEANPALIADLRRVRPRDLVLRTAISARTDATLAFGVCEVSELSSLLPDHIRSFGTAAGVVPTSVPNLHVNDLLERYSDRVVDFLSIDIEGVDLELLEAIDFSRFRPTVIQCEPSEHFLPGMASRMIDVMRERGYTLAARTSINLIFVAAGDRDASAARPAVNSFDVFDTLIARRCIDPLLVFEAVEGTTGVAGFAAIRREVEVALSGSSPTLADIHAGIADRLGLDAAAAAALTKAEIDAELDQVIPIAENLARVTDGDLLLSDMYLPTNVIRALLEKAGLDRRVGLMISTDGKHSGRIWPQALAKFAIGRHLGDNPVADVAMPRRSGIASELSRLAEPSLVERWCLVNGLRGLGELVRAARLRIVTPDPLARRLLWVQTQYNFPILLLASVALHRHATATGATRLLFSSRDCFLWRSLYSALFPDGITTEYFYTSRRIRVEPSPAYRDYARSLLGPASILIDLCGTGWSSALLLRSLGLPDRALYFLHRLAPIQRYEEQHITPNICRVDTILGPERGGLDHPLLEMCNYAPHGSVVGMHFAAGVAVPVFDFDDRSAVQLALVGSQVDCFRAMVLDARDTLAGDSVPLKNADIAELIAALYAILCQETCLRTAFGESHYREDIRTLVEMRLPVS